MRRLTRTDFLCVLLVVQSSGAWFGKRDAAPRQLAQPSHPKLQKSYGKEETNLTHQGLNKATSATKAIEIIGLLAVGGSKT